MSIAVSSIRCCFAAIGRLAGGEAALRLQEIAGAGVPRGPASEPQATGPGVAQGRALAEAEEAPPVRARWLPRQQLRGSNQKWALDFAHDVIVAGRAIRMLSVLDAFTRECPALEVDTGLAGWRGTSVLDKIIGRLGCPQAIRCDNGTELTS